MVSSMSVLWRLRTSNCSRSETERHFDMRGPYLKDEITKRVNEFMNKICFLIEKFYLNPWDDVDATEWYLHKRLRLGFKLDEPSGPQAWLFSLAEIAESSRWVSGGRESLSADTNWCIDWPFFLHPNRNELDDRSRSSIFAKVVLLKNVLSILVGRLISYFHRNGLKMPLTPRLTT